MNDKGLLMICSSIQPDHMCFQQDSTFPLPSLDLDILEGTHPRRDTYDYYYFFYP